MGFWLRLMARSIIALVSVLRLLASFLPALLCPSFDVDYLFGICIVICVSLRSLGLSLSYLTRASLTIATTAAFASFLGTCGSAGACFLIWLKPFDMLKGFSATGLLSWSSLNWVWDLVLWWTGRFCLVSLWWSSSSICSWLAALGCGMRTFCWFRSLLLPWHTDRSWLSFFGPWSSSLLMRLDPSTWLLLFWAKLPLPAGL